MHTVDGTSWEQLHHPVPQANFNAVTFVDRNHGWIVGRSSSSPYQPIILATANGGQTWIEQLHLQKEGNLDDIFFVNADCGWAVGRNFVRQVIVLRTTNGGANWSSEVAPSGNNASSVCFISPLEGYLAVNNWPTQVVSTLYTTDNGGVTWSQCASAVPDEYADKVQLIRGSIHIFLLFSGL